MRETSRSNYRVIVEVADFRFSGRDTDTTHNLMLRDGRELAEQVDRHCDGQGKATVEYDTEYTCSHCGYNWEVDFNGLPVCCDEAQKEFYKEKAGG